MRFVTTVATIVLLAASPAWAQEPAKTPPPVEMVAKARNMTPQPTETDILRKQRNVLAATVLDLQAEVERMRSMPAPTAEMSPAPASAP